MPLMLSPASIQAGLPTGNFASYRRSLDDVRVRGDRSATRSSCASRSASSAASRRGTTRCTRSSPRSRPALAAGCTVVLKPSEVAPLNAFILAEIIDEVGLPAGVFNLVTGVGPVVGEAIAAHPDVDMVSFTGSTRAGKRVAELGAETVKRVALELGGKSANVILDDADLDKAVADGVGRLLPQLRPDLHRAHPHARAARAASTRPSAIAAAAAEAFTLGDPFDERRPASARWSRPPSATGCAATSRRASTRAPRSSPAAPSAPEGLDTGYFVQPTVFADVTRDMTIAQEEIFGPVLSIMPYDDEDEAVAHRQRHRLRPGRRRVVGRPRPRQGASPAGCAPARSTSTAARFNLDGPVRRLQAVGHRPRVRARSASRSSSRSSRCSSDVVPAADGLGRTRWTILVD